MYSRVYGAHGKALAVPDSRFLNGKRHEKSKQKEILKEVTGLLKQGSSAQQAHEPAQANAKYNAGESGSGPCQNLR